MQERVQHRAHFEQRALLFFQQMFLVRIVDRLEQGSIAHRHRLQWLAQIVAGRGKEAGFGRGCIDRAFDRFVQFVIDPLALGDVVKNGADHQPAVDRHKAEPGDHRHAFAGPGGNEKIAVFFEMTHALGRRQAAGAVPPGPFPQAGDKIGDCLRLQFGPVPLECELCLAVRHDYRTILVEDEHRIGRIFQNMAEPRLAFAQASFLRQPFRDVGKGYHDASDAGGVGTVGLYPAEICQSVFGHDLPGDRLQFLQHGIDIGEQMIIDEFGPDVCNRATHIGRDQIEQILRRRREAPDPVATVEKNRRNARAGDKIR